jgi:hypothetical protein
MLVLVSLFCTHLVYASDVCTCNPGPVPQNVSDSLASGNNATISLLQSVHKTYHSATPCFQALFRETFLLCAAWEGSHIAFGRFSRRNPKLENYFLFPTFCSAAVCVDNRVDWLKNALWDAAELYYVAQLAIVAGTYVYHSLDLLHQITAVL